MEVGHPAGDALGISHALQERDLVLVLEMLAQYVVKAALFAVVSHQYDGIRHLCHCTQKLAYIGVVHAAPEVQLSH